MFRCDVSYFVIFRKKNITKTKHGTKNTSTIWFTLKASYHMPENISTVYYSNFRIKGSYISGQRCTYDKGMASPTTNGPSPHELTAACCPDKKRRSCCDSQWNKHACTNQPAVVMRQRANSAIYLSLSLARSYDNYDNVIPEVQGSTVNKKNIAKHIIPGTV